MHETGEYDLEGLFVRLNAAVSRVGARRVVLDSIDTLFAGIPNEAILRSELRRLFNWLKERELTTVITAERGEKASPGTALKNTSPTASSCSTIV